MMKKRLIAYCLLILISLFTQGCAWHHNLPPFFCHIDNGKCYTRNGITKGCFVSSIEMVWFSGIQNDQKSTVTWKIEPIVQTKVDSMRFSLFQTPKGFREKVDNTQNLPKSGYYILSINPIAKSNPAFNWRFLPSQIIKIKSIQEINIPKIGIESTKTNPKNMLIAHCENGNIFINGKLMDIASLSNLFEKNESSYIAIQFDRNKPALELCGYLKTIALAGWPEARFLVKTDKGIRNFSYLFPLGDNYGRDPWMRTLRWPAASEYRVIEIRFHSNIQDAVRKIQEAPTKKNIVLFRAEERVSYQQFINLLSACWKAGMYAYQISLSRANGPAQF